MANVTVATFVIGAEAAGRVKHQLALSDEYLAARGGGMGCDHLSRIGRTFDQFLSRSPDGFETECLLTGAQPLRVTCTLRQRTAGILYVVRANQLETVNLLLSGVDPKADASAIDEVGYKLSPVDAYFESLAVVRFGARPMLATFCSRAGGLDRNIDCVQLAFAAVFFQRCALPLMQPSERDQPGRSAAHPVKPRRGTGCVS